VTGDGISVCEEVGFGFGGGVDINGGGLAQPGNDLTLDVSAGCGPASFGYDATLDHCGNFTHGAKGKLKAGPLSVSVDDAGKVKFGAKASFGGGDIAIDSSGKVGGSLDVEGPRSLKGFKGKCSISGKIAGVLCQRF
jgi:hypothetical protein